MTQEHPITPPPELVKQWATANGTVYKDLSVFCQNIANEAARWGADQELEACCEWLRHDLDAYELVDLRAVYLDHNLRAARRPKPPSLKEQALQELAWVDKNLNMPLLNQCDAIHTIRRALESLPD